MGASSLSLLETKPSLCNSRCWMEGYHLKAGLENKSQFEYGPNTSWVVSERSQRAPKSSPIPWSMGELKEPFISGLPPLENCGYRRRFSDFKKIHLYPSTHCGLGKKKKGIVRVYSLVCKQLFGKKGFNSGCVSWQRLGGQGCAASMGSLSHLLPFRAQQAAEWQDHIFLEWPNGFSYISC